MSRVVLYTIYIHTFYIYVYQFLLNVMSCYLMLIRLKDVDEAGSYMEISVPNASASEGESNLLRMSRSFGDFVFKRVPSVPVELQPVIAVPTITCRVRSVSDRFVVMGSDGVFDVLGNQEVVDTIQQSLIGSGLLGGDVKGEGGSKQGGVSMGSVFSLGILGKSRDAEEEDEKGSEELAIACDKLLEKCIDKGTTDNMSVIVIWLHTPTATPSYTASEVTAGAVAESSSSTSGGGGGWIGGLTAAVRGTAKRLFED